MTRSPSASPCSTCGGSGAEPVWGDACPTCRGHGYVLRAERPPEQQKATTTSAPEARKEKP